MPLVIAHGWKVFTEDGTKHVKPVDDLRPHEGMQCWCRPLLDNGVVVHNSMDRREFIERGESRTQ